MTQTFDVSRHLTLRNGDFTISTDPGLIDEAYVIHFLTTAAYWSRGIDPDFIRSALRYSELLGLYEKTGRRSALPGSSPTTPSLPI